MNTFDNYQLHAENWDSDLPQCVQNFFYDSGSSEGETFSQNIYVEHETLQFAKKEIQEEIQVELADQPYLSSTSTQPSSKNFAQPAFFIQEQGNFTFNDNNDNCANMNENKERRVFEQAFNNIESISNSLNSDSMNIGNFMSQSTYSTNSTSESHFEEEISNTSSPTKNKSENPLRNMPVLVFQRIVSSCSEALKPERDLGGRLNYLVEVIRMHLPRTEDRQKFQQLLGSFSFGNQRTWKIIEKNLQGKDASLVHTLLDCTYAFLSVEGQHDFENWLLNGKMKKDNKGLMRERKDWFKKQFVTKFDTRSFLGEFSYY